MSHREVICCIGGQLHRVLEQARAGRETRRGQIRRPGVVVPHRMKDTVVVNTGTVSHLKELVCDGELHVAPGVRQKLCNLSLSGRGTHHLNVQMGEELAGALESLVAHGADQLWLAVNLPQGVTLRHSLRAESDLDAPAMPQQPVHDIFGGARVNSAAQDDQGPVPHARSQLVHDALE
jgi:hypothetical protein